MIGSIVSFIVLPIILLISKLFRNSRVFKKQKNRIDKTIENMTGEERFAWMSESSKNETVATSQKSWPAFLKVVAWLLCFICIVGGSFILLGIALTMGNDQTYAFMASMIASLLVSILLTQPLQVNAPTFKVHLLYPEVISFWLDLLYSCNHNALLQKEPFQ